MVLVGVLVAGGCSALSCSPHDPGCIDSSDQVDSRQPGDSLHSGDARDSRPSDSQSDSHSGSDSAVECGDGWVSMDAGLWGWYCGVTSEGCVKCWGGDAEGLSSYLAENAPSAQGFSTVSVPDYWDDWTGGWACATRSEGGPKCWTAWPEMGPWLSGDSYDEIDYQVSVACGLRSEDRALEYSFGESDTTNVVAGPYRAVSCSSGHTPDPPCGALDAGGVRCGDATTREDNKYTWVWGDQGRGCAAGQDASAFCWLARRRW